jgi:hypothetical protein
MAYAVAPDIGSHWTWIKFEPGTPPVSIWHVPKQAGARLRSVGTGGAADAITAPAPRVVKIIDKQRNVLFIPIFLLLID